LQWSHGSQRELYSGRGKFLFCRPLEHANDLADSLIDDFARERFLRAIFGMLVTVHHQFANGSKVARLESIGWTFSEEIVERSKRVDKVCRLSGLCPIDSPIVRLGMTQEGKNDMGNRGASWAVPGCWKRCAAELLVFCLFGCE